MKWFHMDSKITIDKFSEMWARIAMPIAMPDEYHQIDAGQWQFDLTQEGSASYIQLTSPLAHLDAEFDFFTILAEYVQPGSWIILQQDYDQKKCYRVDFNNGSWALCPTAWPPQ